MGTEAVDNTGERRQRERRGQQQRCGGTVTTAAETEILHGGDGRVLCSNDCETAG